MSDASSTLSQPPEAGEKKKRKKISKVKGVGKSKQKPPRKKKTMQKEAIDVEADYYLKVYKSKGCYSLDQYSDCYDHCLKNEFTVPPMPPNGCVVPLVSTSSTTPSTSSSATSSNNKRPFMMNVY